MNNITRGVIETTMPTIWRDFDGTEYKLLKI
jgi:hypothetical protein